MLIKDGIRAHPKVLRAGAEAAWLWVCAIDYSRSNLLDGFVPEEALRTLGVFRTPVAKLTERCIMAGLFDRAEDGVVVHDYLDHNDPKTVVLADKEWDRTRKSLYADAALISAIKERDNNQCRYCGVSVSWKDRRGPKGGQFDHVIPRGPNTLENVVVSCRGCNMTKGARTPDQAGMKLSPVPTHHEPGAGIQVGSSSELGPTCSPRARVGVGVGTGVGNSSVGTEAPQSPPRPRELFGDDLWNAWREAGARHGVDRIPANPSGTNWREQMPRVLATITSREELEAALDAWWASPHVKLARVFGSFASDLPELLAHLAAHPSRPFRDPELAKAKANIRLTGQAGGGFNVGGGCEHDPPCGTYLEHQRRWLDEERAKEGLPPRQEPRTPVGGQTHVHEPV